MEAEKAVNKLITYIKSYVEKKMEERFVTK